MSAIRSRGPLAVFVLLVALAVYNYAWHLDDTRAFARIAAEACAGHDTDRGRLEALMEWTRENVPGRVQGPTAWWVTLAERVLTPFPRRALYTGGHCGMKANLFSALCGAAGIRTRLAFLHVTPDVAGTSPSHVVVECSVDGRWAVADPSYAIVFEAEDGELATVNDLRADPELVAAQVPEDYPLDLYNYDYATRWNWNAVPILMPAAYRAFRAVRGEAVDEMAGPAIRRQPRLELTWLFVGLAVLWGGSTRLIARRRARPPTASDAGGG